MIVTIANRIISSDRKFVLDPIFDTSVFNSFMICVIFFLV